jgi:hypothetical protein
VPSIEERDGARCRGARQHSRHQPQILCPSGSDRSCKDAGAIGERKLPRTGKYLSGYERGLIEFLDALPEEQAKLDEKVEAKAEAEGTTTTAAEAKVAAEAQAKLEAEAA